MDSRGNASTVSLTHVARSGDLERRFAEQGIRLISKEVGARMLDEELRWGRKGEAEVIVTGSEAAV